MNWAIYSAAGQPVGRIEGISIVFGMAIGWIAQLILGKGRTTSQDWAQALKLLRDPRLSVAHVAERLGYQTEAAFRRGFKRVHGYGPGSVRRKSS